MPFIFEIISLSAKNKSLCRNFKNEVVSWQQICPLYTALTLMYKASCNKGTIFL